MWLCKKCNKPVYFAERKQSLGFDWHPKCLRCEECGKRLNPGQHAEHKGIPFCHHPCYGTLFGPQLFGHGTRNECHKSFGNVESRDGHIKRSHLESQLKVYNSHYDGKYGELQSREVNGRLFIEGALRIYWGVKTTIHLREEDDARVIACRRKTIHAPSPDYYDSSTLSDSDYSQENISSLGSVDNSKLNLQSQTEYLRYSSNLQLEQNLHSKLSNMHCNQNKLNINLQSFSSQNTNLNLSNLHSNTNLHVSNQNHLQFSNQNNLQINQNLQSSKQNNLQMNQNLQSSNQNNLQINQNLQVSNQNNLQVNKNLQPSNENNLQISQNNLEQKQANVLSQAYLQLNHSNPNLIRDNDLDLFGSNSVSAFSNSESALNSIVSTPNCSESTTNCSEPTLNRSESALNSSEPAVNSSEPAVNRSESALNGSEKALNISEPRIDIAISKIPLNKINHNYNDENSKHSENGPICDFNSNSSKSGPISETTNSNQSKNGPISDLNSNHSKNGSISATINASNSESQSIARKNLGNGLRSGSTALRRRPGVKMEKSKIKRRCSINGHFYLRETSSFTPPFGSFCSIRITSKTTVDDVIGMLVNKYKIEMAPTNFALFIFKENGELRRLRDEESPLITRVMLGPHEHISKIFIMDAQFTEEITPEAAQFLNLSLAECSAILNKYDQEERMHMKAIVYKYQRLRACIEKRLLANTSTTYNIF